MTPTTNPTIDEIKWKDPSPISATHEPRVHWIESLLAIVGGALPAAYIVFVVTATLVAGDVSVPNDHGAGLMLGSLWGIASAAAAAPFGFYAARRWLLSLGRR